MKYKALTVTPPWGTLIAIGAKKIETRSWPTGYRGPLLIHQGSNLRPVGGDVGLMELCNREPFCSALEFEPDPFKAAMLANLAPFQRTPAMLPRGAIVAVCELKDCRIIGRELNGDATIAADDMISFTPILGNERAFGDYSPGRYSWLLANVRALPEPIPARGALGLWDWEGQVLG